MNRSYRHLNGVSVHHHNLALAFDSAILCDLDNTLTDSRYWFGKLIIPALKELARSLGVRLEAVARAYTAQAMETGLHEDAFLVERLVAHCPCALDLSDQLVGQIRRKFWKRFDRHHKSMRTFPGVMKTLRKLKQQHPRTAFIVGTDAPRDTAQERLAILGILGEIDGLVSVESPQPPQTHQFPQTISASKARTQTINRAFIARTRHFAFDVGLTCELSKPSPVGPGLVLELLGIKPTRLILVGDSPGKEGEAGHAWEKENGVARGTIASISCLYGQKLPQAHHNAARLITSLPKEPPEKGDVAVRAEIHRFSELPDVVARLLTERSREPLKDLSIARCAR